MRVGLSLLTFSAGDLGGSETYARQLVRSLANVGTLDYAVLVPARAKDAAEGLPAIEVKDPPVAKRAEQLLDVDGRVGRNPCRIAVFGVVRGHRGILAGAQEGGMARPDRPVG